MLKQMISIIAIIFLSILITVMMPYAQQALSVLLNGYQWVSTILTEVFSGGQTGNLVRNVIALLAIPLLIGLIPAIIYWFTKRGGFPYFMEIVWIVWLIQTAALIIQYKAG